MPGHFVANTNSSQCDAVTGRKTPHAHVHYCQTTATRTTEWAHMTLRMPCD